MKSYIIAVDFDGTMCEDKWPHIGAPNNKLINHLIQCQKKDAKLILWTCRVGKPLDEAIQWSEKQGIKFDAINENLPEVLEWMGGDSRKIFANEYIDDRALLLPFVKHQKLTNTKPLKNNHFTCEYADNNRCALYKSKCDKEHCLRNGICSLCKNEDGDTRNDLCNDCFYMK